MSDWRRNNWKPSKNDKRDYSFEDLKKEKEIKTKIPDDLLEHEITVRLVLGVPLKELEKVRKAIKNLISKYDIRDIETKEEF